MKKAPGDACSTSYDLLKEGVADSADSVLPEVLQVIGHREGIAFKFPSRSDRSQSAVGLNAILDASGVRARRVRLKRKDKWWLSDSNSMLAFRAEDGRPVALAPGLLERYREVDPVRQSTTRVTAERAGRLRDDAWLFYRSLPSTSAGPADLFRIAGKRLTGDLIRLVLAGLPSGLIMLLPALVLGLVAEDIIPDGDTGLLYATIVAQAAFALVGVMLHVLQGMALMCLEGRTTSRLEAAFWDRLLRLSPGMLHRYPAGDLAMRGMTFQNLRNAVQGVVANAILSVFFLLPASIVIFLYDAIPGRRGCGLQHSVPDRDCCSPTACFGIWFAGNWPDRKSGFSNALERTAPSGCRLGSRYCHPPPNPLMLQEAAQRWMVPRRRIWLHRTNG